ncbi:MAG: DUF4124 domain-containing protein [Burkholderiales bacterium]
MRPALAAMAGAVFALAATGAPAQALYKCVSPGGSVTYQETPCTGERSQKRLDAPRPVDPEEVRARRLLEREALHGDELAGRFAREARERELARQRERELLAREERLRLLRERENRAAEDVPWNPPWGFPARPGLALPKPPPPAPPPRPPEPAR